MFTSSGSAKEPRDDATTAAVPAAAVSVTVIPLTVNSGTSSALHPARSTEAPGRTFPSPLCCGRTLALLGRLPRRPCVWLSHRACRPGPFGFDIDHGPKRFDLSTLETEDLPVRSAKVSSRVPGPAGHKKATSDVVEGGWTRSGRGSNSGRTVRPTGSIPGRSSAS